MRPGGDGYAQWPRTAEGDWCEDWEKKPPQDEQSSGGDRGRIFVNAASRSDADFAVRTTALLIGGRNRGHKFRPS